MTRIPTDPIGYSVNQSTGTVHTRYAGDHAGDSYRTRTVRGVETLLDGKEPNTCSVCYPHPFYKTTPPPSEPQRRRSGPRKASS